MTNLPNAPLVYTLGLVRFPALPEAVRFVPRFHEAIRNKYPHASLHKVQQANVHVTPDGMRIDQSTAEVWQFAEPERRWAFIFSSQVLALHTVAYLDHESFNEAFTWGLSRLLEVPDIKILYAEAVGMRYVDRVVPRRGEDLRSYLKESVLPPAFNEVEGLDLAEAVYASRYVTGEAEMRFQVLLNPPTVLPPELETPLVQQNGWAMTRPDRTFAVVDIDHSVRFPTLQPMDEDSVKGHMLRLRAVAKAVFIGMSTDHAKRVWEGSAQ